MTKSQQNSAIMLLIFAFLLLASSSSFSVVAARFLIKDVDFLLSENLPAEPARNLVLPGILPVVKTAAEEASPAGGRYLPCDSAVVSGSRKVGVSGFHALRLCGKRSQLLLSMLPKGGVPPSGPSHRTNDVNN